MFKKKLSDEDKIINDIADKQMQIKSTFYDARTQKEWEETYFKLNETLINISIKESEKLDKGLLTLSSIFLGFTLTFVDKIVPLKYAWYKWLLYIDWFSFFLSIVAVLLGLLLNIKGQGQVDKNAKKYLIDHNPSFVRYTENKLINAASTLTLYSFILFVLGSGSFLFFVFLNVIRIN